MEARNHNNHNRDDLLYKLTALDFMLVDLALFLNTHPDEREAVDEYNKVVNEADRIRAVYENHFGPLCSYRSKNQAPTWIWSDDPWPWSTEGNFNLLEREVL